MLKIEVVGNLGADARIMESNGSKFVSFRVASVDRWTTESGEKKESVSWIDCTYNNVESKIVEYLKTGQKVFIRGNGSTRVYSSQKERRMMAGLKCAVSEIELLGGQTDDVPRQVIIPDTGQILDVTKHYWVQIDTKKWKANDTAQLIDSKGRNYIVNKAGFVVPAPTAEENESSQSDNTNENSGI